MAAQHQNCQENGYGDRMGWGWDGDDDHVDDDDNARTTST